jgi:hypothetical protein
VPLEGNQSFVTQKAWDAFTKPEDGLNEQYGRLVFTIDPATVAKELSICAHLASPTASQPLPPAGHFALITSPQPRTLAPPDDEAFIRGISVYLPGASAKTRINVRMQPTGQMLTHVKNHSGLDDPACKAAVAADPTNLCDFNNYSFVGAPSGGASVAVSYTTCALYYRILYCTMLCYYTIRPASLSYTTCSRRFCFAPLHLARLPLPSLPALPVRRMAGPHETRSLAHVRAWLARGAAHSIDARKPAPPLFPHCRAGTTPIPSMGICARSACSRVRSPAGHTNYAHLPPASLPIPRPKHAHLLPTPKHDTQSPRHHL